MKTLKKTVAVLLSVVMMLTAVAGCGSSAPASSEGAPSESEPASSSAGAVSDGVLHARLEEQDAKEQIKASWSDYGGLFRCSLFSRLLMLDADGKPTKKDLASDYTVSDDGLTYSFTIQENATWHDGTPITGEDIGWSVEMALKSTQINSVFINAFKKIEGADKYLDGSAEHVSGISVDGKKVTFKLSEPCGSFLLTMAQWPPYPKHLLEKEDPATLHQASFWMEPVGSGPYKFKEFQPGSYVILEAYDGYYGEKPQIKTIKFDVTSDSQLAVKAQAGEVDYFATMAMSKETIDQILTKNPSYEAHEVTNMLYMRQLVANLNGSDGKGNDKIKDIRVRQAVMYALDRDTICEQIYSGQAQVMNSAVPTSYPEYDDSVTKFSYDPEKAKALLKEAGYDFSKPIRIGYYYNDQQTIDLMDTVKHYLEQVGFTVELNFLKGDLLSLIYEVRDYDFIYCGLSAMSWDEVYSSHGSSSMFAKIFGSEYTESWAAMLKELSQVPDEEKGPVLKKLQQHEAETMEWMPLWNMKMYILVNKDRLDRPGDYANEWTNYDRSLASWTLK